MATKLDTDKLKCPRCGHTLKPEEVKTLWGILGGTANKRKHSKAYFKALGKKGMSIRYGKKY